MGCCQSAATNATKSRNSGKNRHPFSPESQLKKPRASQPPPQFEEETVKEVLSETPIIPKPLAPRNVQIELREPLRNDKIEISQEPKPEPEPEPAAVPAVQKPKPTEEIVVSEVSEVSEMCSYSGSFSATTLTEKRDEDDGEVTQRVHRSPARVVRKRPEFSGRDSRGVRPPARRSVPSPEKKGSLPGRTTAQRRNVGPSMVARRDVSGDTARRSRSPARRVEAGPRRRESPAPVSAVKTEEKGRVEEKKVNDDVLPESSESLENPLVSLECFIFL